MLSGRDLGVGWVPDNRIPCMHIRMSVRQSLLAILDQGPCYGYQLRAEFDRRTGSAWPLNVGQIYNTLDRLERDGLVAKGEADAEGHVYWAITDAGRADVRAWLAAPVDRPAMPRDELVVKLALAATLPGVDVVAVVRAERVAADARLAARESERDVTDPADVAAAVILEAAVARAEAEVAWLSAVAERFARHPPRSLPLAAERPARGRPRTAD
jgi:DNA-binding PadR family transcriptional regulator